LETNVLNQKSNTEIDKTNDKYSFDEESEFLLEDYDQSSNDDDFEELSQDKIQYEGIKVIVFIHILYLI
jgi:hypothetical protein